MKKCTNCKVEKEIISFNKNKSKGDGYNNICKECSKSRSKQYYEENKALHKSNIKLRNKKTIFNNRTNYFNILKQSNCIDCPENNPIVLEFDHRDGVKKIEAVGKMVGAGYSWEVIKKEIEKCDVRCANCHRKRTAKQQGWYKDLM
mgnify:CR=1 FL=1